MPGSEACTHCGQNDQWVSHGYVYKRLSREVVEVTGKRIICSTRYGRRGCGHTRQLYRADVIPRCCYGLSTLIAFIQALLCGSSVESSFHQAVQSDTREPRQGWRWVHRLMQGLSSWRVVAGLKPEDEAVADTQRRSGRLSVLLPTLSLLLPQIRDYQWQFQQAFF